MSTITSVANSLGFKGGILEMSNFVSETQIYNRQTVNHLLHHFLEECIIQQIPGFSLLYSEDGDEFYVIKTEDVSAEVTFTGNVPSINLDWFVAGISQKGVLPSSVFLMLIGM